jgi:hypothetical protein
LHSLPIPGGFFPQLGIRDYFTKRLNPDATVADTGEEMKAYFDERRKVWVFPGEDPDEKAKATAGPPPTVIKETAAAPAPSAVADPLAAMMAPPQSRIRRSPARGGVSRVPGMMPGSLPPAAGGAVPPKFAVFTPTPKKEERKEGKKEES